MTFHAAPILGLAGPKGSGKSTNEKILCERHGFVALAFADPLKRLLQTFFEVPKEILWGPSKARDTTTIPLRDPEYLADVDARLQRHSPGADARLPLLPWKEWGFEAALMAFVKALREEQRDPTVREMLRWVGTDWAVTHDPMVWIRETLRTVEDLRRGGVFYTYDPAEGIKLARGPLPSTGPWTGQAVVLTDVRHKTEAEAIRRIGGKVWWMDAAQRLAAAPKTRLNQHASEPTRERFAGMISLDLDCNGDPAEQPSRIDVAMQMDFGGSR